MRTLKLIIDNPALEQKLNDFEDAVVCRPAKMGEYSLLPSAGDIHLWTFDSAPYGVFVLAPKPTPLPEPDWSKLQMLKRGTWLVMDPNKNWWSYATKPRFNGDVWFSSENKGKFLHFEFFNLSAFPEVPPDRAGEACWQVP